MKIVKNILLQASFCLDNFWKYWAYRHQPLNLENCSIYLQPAKKKKIFLIYTGLHFFCNFYLFPLVVLRVLKFSFTAAETS